MSGSGSFADRAAPFAFVFIWATGFVVARLVAPHAEPLTFLCLRYMLAVAVLSGIAVASGAVWPRGLRGWFDAFVSGVLIQGIYLGGVFWAVSRGLPAGIAALVAGLQPLLTAALSGPLLGETISGRRWLGIFIGFAGVVLVLSPKLGTTDGLPYPALAACFAAMIAITLGTIWQKRTSGAVDLRTNAAVQFIAAFIVTAPVALFTETLRFDFGSPEAWIGLLWAVFALSVGGIRLLLMLIRRGAVAGVAALIYLVPPVSALMAFAMFGDTLTLVQIMGMGVAALGVAVASRAR